MKKNIKILLGLIILSSISISCQEINLNKSNTPFLTQSKSHEIVLPLPQGQVYSSNIEQFITIEDSLHILVYYYPKSYICDYNIISKKLVRKIPIPLHMYEIGNFNYLNEDSILFLGDSGYKYNNDSAIVLSNSKGDLKEILPLHHPKIISSFSFPQFISYPEDTSLNNSNFDSIIFPYSPPTYRPNSINMFERIYLIFLNSRIGRSKNIKPFPIVAYYDYQNKKLNTSDKIWFPSWKPNKYYPNENYRCDMSTTVGNKLLISFKNSSLVYRTDADLNVIDTLDIKSEFIKITESADYPFNDDSDVKYPFYGSIFYIPQNKMYMRAAYLSPNIKTAIFTDENFNYLGESIFNSYISMINDDGIWSWKIKGDSVYYTAWNFNLGTYNHEYLEAQIDSLRQSEIKKGSVCATESIFKENAKSLSIYAQKEFGIKDSTFSLIVINNDGCPSCVDYVMRFLSINKNVLFHLKKKPLYLVYRKGDEYQSTLKRVLKQYNLDETQRIFIDTTYKYNLYNPFSDNSNPRLFLYKDQKMILDTIYNPNDLEDLPNQILNFYELD